LSGDPIEPNCASAGSSDVPLNEFEISEPAVNAANLDAVPAASDS
jgi:hypothetical protein